MADSLDNINIQPGLTAQVRRLGTSATTGTTAIIPAKANHVIRVLWMLCIRASEGVTIQFKSGTTNLSTALPDPSPGFMATPNPMGYLQTQPGEALNVTLTGGTVHFLMGYTYLPRRSQYSA